MIPRRSLLVLGAAVLALHWLVLAGLPLQWHHPVAAAPQVFNTRTLAAPAPPASASPAPTSAPSNMRGTRISHTICSCPALQLTSPIPNSLLSNMCHTTSTGTRAGPKPSDTTHDTSSNAPRPVSNRA